VLIGTQSAKLSTQLLGWVLFSELHNAVVVVFSRKYDVKPCSLSIVVNQDILGR